MATRIVGVMGPGATATPEECRTAERLGALIANEGWTTALLHESSRARTMALLHEYPLRVGRRGPHFSGPRMVQQIDRD